MRVLVSNQNWIIFKNIIISIILRVSLISSFFIILLQPIIKNLQVARSPTRPMAKLHKTSKIPKPW